MPASQLPDNRVSGTHSLQPYACYRCGRALQRNERIPQEGVIVCSDCVYTHDPSQYQELTSMEYAEYKGPVIIGGRTGSG